MSRLTHEPGSAPTSRDERLEGSEQASRPDGADDAIADIRPGGLRADGSRADGTGQGPDTDDEDDGFSAG
jgi:hypothetical protein